MRTLLATALMLLALPASAGEIPPDINARFERLRSATDALTEYSYTFRREEWLGGKQQHAHVMAVKFREPFAVYMTWVGDVHTGRELIYRKGWNDDRLRVKPTPGAFVPVLNLDPNGKLAMRGSRHGIELLDINNVVALILAQTDRIRASDTLVATYTEQGVQLVNGEPSFCIRADLPKDQDPQLYAQRVDLCVNEATGLLTRLRAWDEEDGQTRKVEDYEFRDLNSSPGFTDLDFDPENGAYGF